MTAADFGIHIPSEAAGGPRDAGTDARLQRMAEAGWSVPDEALPMAVALRGAAQICHRDGLTAVGMIFLDNRDSVLARLGGTADPAWADLDLALALHAVEGPDFVRALSGSFAFVIQDRKTGLVEGYRDHFGVYPFYYVLQDRALSCASDPRAALHLSACALEADPLRIADFVAGAAGDRERTAFEGLRRLPAAHRLRLDVGRVDLTRYWDLTSGPEIPTKKAAAVLRARLDAATRARMGDPGKGTVGAMLSGGLDSSSLAGLAARECDRRGDPPLQTLSFVYPGAPHDETPYIEAANAAYGTTPRLMPITEAPKIDVLTDLLEQQMEPFSGMGLLKSHRLYHEARALGLSALIDGHGGDEVISLGNGLEAELVARRRWLALYRTLRQRFGRRGRVLWGIFCLRIEQYGGLDERHLLRRMLWRLRRRLLADQPMTKPFKPIQDLVAPTLRAQLSAERHAPAPQPATREERRHAERFVQLQNLRSPRMQHGFEVLHRAAAAAGIEPLYPFFDRAVVEATVSMPAETKYRDGQSRWVLKEAMRGILPEAIRTRNDKANFQAEIVETLRPFYAREPDTVFDDLASFVNVAEARRIRDRLLADRHDFYDLNALGMLAVLVYWMRALSTWRARQAEGRLI